MTDFENAIQYLVNLSGEEWKQGQKAIYSCSETMYCLEGCLQQCAVADLLREIAKGDSQDKSIKSIRSIIDRKYCEVRNKPLYCLEQGFCALYCVSSCPIGNFMRIATRERALECEPL